MGTSNGSGLATCAGISSSPPSHEPPKGTPPSTPPERNNCAARGSREGGSKFKSTPPQFSPIHRRTSSPGLVANSSSSAGRIKMQ
eukprot:scaffold62529_cov30-Tisochrysis_lutea.AAC.2